MKQDSQLYAFRRHLRTCPFFGPNTILQMSCGSSCSLTTWWALAAVIAGNGFSRGTGLAETIAAAASKAAATSSTGLDMELPPWRRLRIMPTAFYPESVCL